jgi:hypothetical protein
VEAARQYAQYGWPAVSNRAGSPTALGFGVQVQLLVGFFLLIHWSVSFFGLRLGNQKYCR